MKTFLGYVTEQAAQNCQDAPCWLPGFSFYEVHQSELMRAAPEAMIQAVFDINMEDDPLIGTLLKLRELPGRVRSRFSRTPPAAVEPFGLHSFTPLHRDSHLLELGLAGKFWGKSLDMPRVDSAEAFLRFDDPKAAKLVLRFQVLPQPGGGHRLRTETFIYCPTPGVRVRFSCYWAAIRPASGWIRRRSLRLIQLRIKAVN